MSACILQNQATGRSGETASARSTDRRQDRVWVAFLLVALAVCLPYWNSLRTPFIFDDWPNILQNPSIRSLWPPLRSLAAPLGTGVAGRPIVNLTYAFNYGLSGEDTWSYHALNLLIHLLAAWVLFAVLRRTLLFGTLARRYREVARDLALAATLIWAVHPLQTQAVTYISQRSESLVGLLFLLTLYCAIRGWQSPAHAGSWHAAAVAACLIGVGTKEVIAAAPFLVLAYDYVFLRKSWRKALRESPVLYGGLAICLVLLGILVSTGGTLAGAIGPHSPLQYAFTQPSVILHYLRLLFWPDSLCFDYAWAVSESSGAWPLAVVLVALIAVSVRLLFACSAVGFLLVWFFATLAPSSSLIPLPDPAFEYRMYLPSAGVTTLASIAAYEVGKRLLGWAVASPGHSRWLCGLMGCFIVAVLTITLGMLTALRNRDYSSSVSIWADTVEKRPVNARARVNLGCALVDAGRPQEAVPHFQRALDLQPVSAKAHNGLGSALARLGRLEEAVTHFRQALSLEPDYADAHYNLAKALNDLGRLEEAVSHYRLALKSKPYHVDAHNNLGLALARLGRLPEAIRHYRAALRLKPGYAKAHNNLGNALLEMGRPQEAIDHYEKALHTDPTSAKAHANFGLALIALGRVRDSLPHLEEAIRLDPGYANAHNTLGIALARLGKKQQAIFHFREALRLQPNFEGARENLERTLGEEVER